MSAAQQHTRLLSTEEASQYLNVSTRTLIRWRVNRTGPSWVKVGRLVRYRPEDLDEYAEAKRVVPVREA